MGVDPLGLTPIFIFCPYGASALSPDVFLLRLQLGGASAAGDHRQSGANPAGLQTAGRSLSGRKSKDGIERKAQKVRSRA